MLFAEPKKSGIKWSGTFVILTIWDVAGACTGFLKRQ